MPLAATHGSLRIEAPDLTPAQWLELKSGYRSAGLTMACGEAGYPKTSPLGMQFFSHMPKSGCNRHEGGPETPEHLALKAALAAAAREGGWIATIEFPAPDRSWIADVLIERGTERVALEVQWSSQSDADFIRRQKRYAAAGVKCLWFVHARNIKAASTVPSYDVAGVVGDFAINFPWAPAERYKYFPVETALAHLFGGTLRKHVEVRTTRLGIHAAMMRCHEVKCGKWMTMWGISAAQAETRCGQTLTLHSRRDFQPWLPSRPELMVEKHVADAIRASGLAKPAPLASARNKMDGREYTGRRCPHCDALQGDGYTAQDRRWMEYVVEGHVGLPIAPDSLTISHVCQDIGRGLCSNVTKLMPGPRFPHPEAGIAEVEPGPISTDYGRQPLPPKKVWT